MGDSKRRLLELCWWRELPALPAKGKEYPELGDKGLRDRPPKDQKQLLRHSSQPAAGPSGSSPAAQDPSGSSSNKRQPADIGSGLADQRAFLFDPATQMGMRLDPGAIQAVSAASGVWREDGCLQGFYRSKLTRSQVQHDSGLIQARHNTQRWNGNIKLELQHLAAATPAGTSLVAIQRHVAVTLATWDAVGGEYLHPKWAEQKMRLHGAQDKVLERYFKKLEDGAAIESQKRWGTRKQLVVFFGNTGIGTRGGWGAKAVLHACRKVVERPNSGKPLPFSHWRGYRSTESSEPLATASVNPRFDPAPAAKPSTASIGVAEANQQLKQPAAGPSGSSPAAQDPSGSSSNKRQPADIGSGLADQRAFLFDPATQMGMGLDPGAIQAVSAASGVWRADGCLEGFYRSKLTRSQVQHDSGLIQARHNTQQLNGNIKLELQHLAAATPAGTSLVAIQRHVAVTLATWDAVWGEYLHPKWAEQKMRLHGAQEKVLERYFKKLEEEAASVSQQQWGARKQLVVFFGNAGIGTRGGWGPKAVLQACRKVVEMPNSGKPTDRVPGMVVTVDEFCTSRVSSIMNSPQPSWSKRFEAPVRGLMWCPWLHQATPGDLGKWVDRDCNAALNLQRAGESEWRPLELCRWPHRGRLPAKGKEYPALGFKKLRDRAPKAQAQQPVAQ
ncbi:hypothetical protein QJQ45_012143 [Haematococcus lacustris]|nr:hypothetical protein QJQ45_012143 [Haematococcus lacustris]